MHFRPRAVWQRSEIGAGFAVGVGALLEHLVKDRGYTSIRWFCMTNEPGMGWGW